MEVKFLSILLQQCLVWAIECRLVSKGWVGPLESRRLFLFRDQVNRGNSWASDLGGGKSELSKKAVVPRLRARIETRQLKRVEPWMPPEDFYTSWPRWVMEPPNCASAERSAKISLLPSAMISALTIDWLYGANYSLGGGPWRKQRGRVKVHFYPGSGGRPHRAYSEWTWPLSPGFEVYCVCMWSYL